MQRRVNKCKYQPLNPWKKCCSQPTSKTDGGWQLVLSFPIDRNMFVVKIYFNESFGLQNYTKLKEVPLYSILANNTH